MLFSDLLPDRLDADFSRKFVSLFDQLHQFKRVELASALRVTNDALCTDKKWLLKKLEEVGFQDFPYAIPVCIMQQVLLNTDTLFRLRGSKDGLELLCSVFSLGEVTVDDSSFWGEATALFVSALSQSFISTDSLGRHLAPVWDTEDFLPQVELTITINSLYFDGTYPTEAAAIQEYLSKIVPDYLATSPGKTITYLFAATDHKSYHRLLNPFFVNF